MPTVGFDINVERIEELKSGRDSTLEVDASELLRGKPAEFYQRAGRA